MREFMISALVLLFAPALWPQAAQSGWKTIKDAKSECQIAVPPDWAPLGDTSGAAVFHDVSTAIAVVTSQPDQKFTPLNATLLKIMAIPKERMFENSGTRIFYQEKVSRDAEDANAFSASVPAKEGTCSVHVVALPSVATDVVKKIVASLAAAGKETSEETRRVRSSASSSN